MRWWLRPWPWVLALVLLRGWLVLSCADVYFYGEEMAKGACAKAIIDRPPVPYWTLAYGLHEGGGFVVAHLKALGFLAFGESILVHKLVGLLTASLVLWAAWKLVAESFGVRAAAILGLLYVLAPEAFLRFSLLTLGTHFEALFFACHVLRLSLRIAKNGGGTLEDWSWLGLAAGFGTYFSLQTAPVTLVAFLVLAWSLRGRLVCKGLAAAAVAWLSGIAPLAAMLALAGEQAVRVRGATPGSGEGGVLQTLLDLFGPLRVSPDTSWLDWTLLAVHCLLALAAPFVLRGKRLACCALLGYVVLYFALYAASGLAVSMGGIWFLWIRLCAPWLATSILAAAAIDALWEHRRPAAWCVLALYAAAGVQDVVRLARTGEPAELARNARNLATAHGVDYPEYFNQLEWHLQTDDASKVRASLALRDDTRELPAGIALAIYDKTDLPTKELLAKVRAAFGERYAQALYGLGRALHPGDAYDLPAAFAAVAEAPATDQPALAEALGRTGIGPRFRVDRLDALVDAPDVPERWRAAWWQGCGWRVRYTFRLLPHRGREWCEARPEPMRSALLAGFEQADRDLRLR